jgi:uncharacterized protein (DUF302 family)
MRYLFFLFLIFSLPLTSQAQKGLITVESNWDVQQTATRLEKLIKQKGLTFFAKIDHAQNAAKGNMKLSPSVL